MNITFKQLEAFYVSAQFGSFSAAAVSLHTTQSAISKRVGDLEIEYGQRLFVRSHPRLTLTLVGQQVLPLAESMLKLRQQLTDVAGMDLSWKGEFRLGVTELTALTWLGGFVRSLRDLHPKLTLEPVVDAGLVLFDLLQANKIDMAIIPGTHWGPHFNVVRLVEVENAWMASPGMVFPDRPLQPAEFESYPVLEQSHGSAKNRYYEAWKAEHGFRFNRIFATNSLPVLSELTIGGFGISQLPKEYFRSELESGLLRIVHSEPMPPPLIYSAVYRYGAMDGRNNEVARLAAQCCDFGCRPRQAQGVA